MGMVLSRDIMLEPYYEIHLNGKKLPSNQKKYITNVEVDESVVEANLGRITISDVDFEFSNMTKLIEKMPIKIYMGFKKHYRLKLKGEITHIEADFGEDGVPILTIGAIDNTNKMTHKKKSRKWSNVKNSDVVKLIAKEYGFKLRVKESINVIESITQEEETDALLISRLANDDGFVFFIIEDTNELFYGEQFDGVTSSDNLYYNMGDNSIMTFRPTLVEKNKAEKVKASSSSVSDSSGNSVSSDTTDSTAPPTTSQAGGTAKHGIDTITGKVTLNVGGNPFIDKPTVITPTILKPSNRYFGEIDWIKRDSRTSSGRQMSGKRGADKKGDRGSIGTGGIGISTTGQSTALMYDSR